MGRTNSSASDMLVIFLNKGLVRKGVGDFTMSFSFPSVSSCQLPLQFPSHSPLLLHVLLQFPEHHSPHSLPVFCVRVNTAKQRLLPHADCALLLSPLTLLCLFYRHLLFPNFSIFLDQERLCRCVFAQLQPLQGLIHCESSQA